MFDGHVVMTVLTSDHCATDLFSVLVNCMVIAVVMYQYTSHTAGGISYSYMGNAVPHLKPISSPLDTVMLQKRIRIGG